MKINKYYVGAQHLAAAIQRGENDKNTHATIDGAINAGKRLVENRAAECVIVVKVVRIIRRTTPPIVVEIV